MTRKEQGIMEDATSFLETFSDAPDLSDPGCDDYWRRASEALSAAGNKWRHHPLVEKVFLGIYEYLEIKQKAVSR